MVYVKSVLPFALQWHSSSQLVSKLVHTWWLKSIFCVRCLSLMPEEYFARIVLWPCTVPKTTVRLWLLFS